MDHKYWLDAYWTNGVTVTVDFSSDTTSGYFFADGSTVTSMVFRITENKIDIYPPAGFETAYLAQAKRGATYYMTHKEAIESEKGGSVDLSNPALDTTKGKAFFKMQPASRLPLSSRAPDGEVCAHGGLTGCGENEIIHRKF